MYRLISRGLVAATVVICMPCDADAQSRRGYDRYGRDFQLHGNGFGRGQGGIYTGRRDSPSPHFTFHYGHGPYFGYGFSPYVYTPYAVPPYAYDPSFGSPAYFGGAYGPYSPYGPVVSAPAPAVVTTPPLIETPPQYHVAESASDAERLRQMFRNEDPDGRFVAARPMSFPESTPEQKLKSLREEQAGDRDFKAGKYLLAYTHYKNAIDAAADRTEPRAKLVVNYATIGQFSRAVDALKNLLQLDPSYPQHFLSLDAIYGEHGIAKDGVKTTTAQWTSEHVANPERLLLLGALMYFDGDIDRSRQLFEKVALYDDLAPLVQGFFAAAPTDIGQPGSGPTIAPPLDVPNADIDITIPPLPIQ